LPVPRRPSFPTRRSSDLPAFYGARAGAGHTATVFHPGGGEFANVATNWLLWHFKGDAKARSMFVGDQCGLCTNPNWEVAAKRLRSEEHTSELQSRENLVC